MAGMRTKEGEGGDGRIPARATVSLAGLGVGQEALVDPSNPYIAGLLDGEYLVPVDPGPVEGSAATQDSPAESA